MLNLDYMSMGLRCVGLVDTEIVVSGVFLVHIIVAAGPMAEPVSVKQLIIKLICNSYWIADKVNDFFSVSLLTFLLSP